jgi:hypothetical protein
MLLGQGKDLDNTPSQRSGERVLPIVGAPVIIEPEMINTDQTVVRDPFSEIGRLVAKLCDDP